MRYVSFAGFRACALWVLASGTGRQNADLMDILEACLLPHLITSTSTHYIPKNTHCFPSFAKSCLHQVPAVDTPDTFANSNFPLHEQRPWLKYGARRVITSVRKTIDLGDLAEQTQRMTQVHWNSSGSKQTRSRSGWILPRTR